MRVLVSRQAALVPAESAGVAEPSRTEEQAGEGRRLRLLTFNIQVGILTERYRHYVTRGWRHVLPGTHRFGQLDRIAQLISGFDLVALQEVDAGSLRTGFTNQLAYIADRAGFPFWYQQVNRNLGKLAQNSNGLLSKYRPREVVEHKLPGLIPGRGAMVVRFGDMEHPLFLVVMHLSLSRRARRQQLEYVSELIANYEHVVLMGDLNCQFPRLQDADTPLAQTKLRPVGPEMHTFPSWHPQRSIDHILVSPSLVVNSVHVVNQTLSDHLPVATEITLPPQVRLTG